ncbi:MAG TPA: sigma-70 family RNA polymerase sigma factor [Mycobacteriales bacterium]|nr:sigma-70 family RNA polymerase sigma factor [Mycobacteriales bacterium]
MNENWQSWAAQAATGDRRAGERLVEMSAGPARRIAGRLIDDPSAVDDVVQEALIDVLATIGSLREPAAYLGWLGLVVRKHADRYRRRLRPTLDLIVDPPIAESDPALTAERQEQIDRVRYALRLARDSDRRLLALRYYGDWTDAELADLLGISRGAVRKRLYDARRRLHPLLTTPPKKGPIMPPLNELFGRVLDPATAPPLPPASELTRAAPELLRTGIKILDTLVPWPRGGAVDFLGPAGTGHLVILREIVHNLSRKGPAVLVAVAADDSPPANLTRLVGLEPAVDTIVVAAGPEPVESAVDYGSRCAAALAASGSEVLLVLDRSAAATTDFAGRVGRTARGSVTGVRVAPHPSNAAPEPERDGVDAVVRTSLDELTAGRYPAIDVLASHSTMLRHANPEHRRIATATRRAIAEAALVRDYLTQNFWVAEEFTGVDGEVESPGDALRGLAALIAAS